VDLERLEGVRLRDGEIEMTEIRDIKTEVRRTSNDG
jgi:hypothetical protein